MRKVTSNETKPSNPYYGQSLNCGYHISRAKWNEDNTACRFSLDLAGGVSLYGLTLRYKDEKPFIYPSSYKGRDGNWYNNYYVKFDDIMLHQIVSDLEGM